jgi:spore maturation protein CgeB
MRDAGFVSNRIFDALASGSVVVSDRVEGLSEIFGGLVPTYSDPVELREVIAELLEDEERRRQIAIEGARLVLDQHTFDQRAEQIMSLLKPRLADRRKDLEGAALEP